MAFFSTSICTEGCDETTYYYADCQSCFLSSGNNNAAADLALVSRPLDKPSMANSAPEKSSDKVVHGRLF